MNIILNIDVEVYSESMKVDPTSFEARGCKSDWDVYKTINQTFLKYPGKVSQDENDNCFLVLEGKKMIGTQSRTYHSLEAVNDINSMNGVDDSEFVIVKAKFKETDSTLDLTLWTVEKEAIETLSGMDCADLSIQTDSQIYPFRMLI